MSASLFLSVVVPSHQGASILPDTLQALRSSDLPPDRWELIVVDDASTDETSVAAARLADTVLRLPGRPHGPAYARNRGFEVSRGDVVVFIDADVRVHADTLRRFANVLECEPEISAVFGSYDAQPAAPGLVSQYRNLLHHYVHQQSAGEAETFWAGCGAIRAEVFRTTGMYDEWHFPAPQIEDIELGRRLRLGGHRIVLRPEIQATHLKRWSLRNVLTTDFVSRGVPWTRLIIQEGPSAAGNTLNVRSAQKWCTALVGLGAIGLVVAVFVRSWWPLLATAGSAGAVLGINFGFYQFLRRQKGAGFALLALPLHLIYYVSAGLSAIIGWFAHALFGAPTPPADVAAFSEVGIETWPPIPSRPERSIWNTHEG